MNLETLVTMKFLFFLIFRDTSRKLKFCEFMDFSLFWSYNQQIYNNKLILFLRKYTGLEALLVYVDFVWLLKD